MKQTNSVGIKTKQSLSIEWCEIPAGEYILSRIPESARGMERGPYGAWYTDSNDLEPAKRRKVVTEQFRISCLPVSCFQYFQFLLSNPIKNFKFWPTGYTPLSKVNPVVNINHVAAKEFCEWASKILGYEVRLPAYREWQIAENSKMPGLCKWIMIPHLKRRFQILNPNVTFSNNGSGMEWTSGGSAKTINWTEPSDSDYNEKYTREIRIYGWSSPNNTTLGWLKPEKKRNDMGFRVVTLAEQRVELIR